MDLGGSMTEKEKKKRMEKLKEHAHPKNDSF